MAEHPPFPPRRGEPASRRTARPLEVAIFAGGLAGAVAAGVVGYRTVGLYGDGPFASGYSRERDPETGRSRLVHETVTKSGRVRRVIDGEYRLRAVELDLDGEAGRLRVEAPVGGGGLTRVAVDATRDGHTDRWEYYDADQRLVKVGFSLAGDAVEDAWAYRDERGELVKIEVSTRRDGRVNRWEYYAGGRMVRVEEDTNMDGRPDRWSSYEDGILVETRVDRDGDGQPDRPQ